MTAPACVEDCENPRVLSKLWRRIGRLLANGLGGSALIPEHQRWRLLGGVGVQVDGPSTLLAGTTYAGAGPITFGPRAFVNRECFFEAGAPITIGADVSIASRVSVLTSTHAIGDTANRAGTMEQRPVTIGNGVWIGASATVLPGVTIGDGCIIAAGATVAKDCAPNGLYAGVPARRLRDLA